MTDRPAAARFADLKDAALRLLARREHSLRELSHKLTDRGWPQGDVEALVTELAETGLQSDERFAESYARSRAEKFYGPMRIRAELGERGINRILVDKTLREIEVDWIERAASWYERRYGAAPPADLKELSRRQQALIRRGFGHDEMRGLLPRTI